MAEGNNAGGNNAATTASWGVHGEVGDVTGIVTDLEIGGEAILAPEYGALGQVIKQTHYDTVQTMTATVEVEKGTNPPDLGEQITIGGLTGYVKSARKVESNRAYCKILVQAELYANCSEVEVAT